MHTGLQFFWDAFWRLGTDRPLAMTGIGRIPWTSINEFAKRYRFDDIDAFERLSTIIVAMDHVYVEFRSQPPDIKLEIQGEDSTYVKVLFGLLPPTTPIPPKPTEAPADG